MFSAPYFGAQHSILPELFGEDERAIGQAASLLQGATRITLVLGPSAAGLLISIVGPLNVLLIDAATFLVALLLVGFLVRPAAPHQVTDVSRPRILDGLRHLLRDGLLRAMLASSLLREPAHQALFVAIPFLVITRFGKHPELVGLFTAAWAGGAVAGSGAGYAVLKRLSSRKVAILGLFGQALPLWVLPLSLGTPVIVAALAISGICNTLTAAPLSAVQSLLTPPSLRPQVNTAAVTVAMLAGVAGAAMAGPALQAFSLSAVLAAVAALLSLGALILLRPLLRSEHADTSHVRAAFRGTGRHP